MEVSSRTTRSFRRAGYVFSVGFKESGFQAVVARASRPCVGCTIRTGGTPVPLRWKRHGCRKVSRLSFGLVFVKVFGAGVHDVFEGAVSSLSPRRRSGER